MRTGTIMLLWAWAVFGSSEQALAQICASRSCERFITIESDKGVAAYTSYDLTSGASDVRRLVVVVHGSGRNAYAVFSNIVKAADSLGQLTETLIVSPLFKTSADAPGPNDLYWTDGGWKRGDLSSSSPRLSSFEVIDRLATLIIEEGRFPNLELVTVVGHSAGGQFTQRYAVGSQIPNDYSHLEFTYVVMNPSSYVYLNPYRPLDGSAGVFGIPSGCSRYDDYKYGLLGRNAYMSRLSAADLISQYPDRYVTYLVGTEDTSRTNNLDTSCSGEAQGYTRYERGISYAAHIERYFPDNNHALGVVPGVGHSSSGMANSPEGKAAIFPAPRMTRDAEPDSASPPMAPANLDVS